MTPDEVLDKAADILQFEREWGKGEFECSTGAVCVDGALRLAAYGMISNRWVKAMDGSPVYFEARNALQSAVQEDMPTTVLVVGEKAGSIKATPNLWYWNDRWAPSKEYVIDKLRDVAKELRG